MRLDTYLVEKNIFDSRTKAKQAIERGEIFIDGVLTNKPSFFVDELKDYFIKRVFDEAYVSLGGFKLSKALKDFNYNVKDKVVCDIGASTGGFTDCLLKNGAKKVYAVDLNDDLLHNSLKLNDRVKQIIKNAKNLSKSDFDENVDLITADVSFMPIEQILYIIADIINDINDVILLIKPQFENERKIHLKNGIVKDKKLRYNSCKKVIDVAIGCNLYPKAFTVAPVNKDKNIEYLLLLRKNENSLFNIDDYLSII